MKRGCSEIQRQYHFKPGQSGNPNGRPRKKECLTSLMVEEVEKLCPFYNQKNKKEPATRTWKEMIVIATMSLAIKGNSTALKEVWERIDGKVALPIIDGKLEIFEDLNNIENEELDRRIKEKIEELK